MEQRRIIIVGGVAGGASAATRARRMNEQAKITLFEKGDFISFANCGMPYYIAGQIAERSNLLQATPDSFARTFNIDVKVRHEVVKIHRAEHQIEVVDCSSGSHFFEPYDVLILSPGAEPMIPQWNGIDKANVFTLRDIGDMERIKSYIDKRHPSRATIIGAGFIGLEMVEVLKQRKMELSVVELQPQILPLLDSEMAHQVELLLRAQGVDLYLGGAVEDLVSENDLAKAVKLKGGLEIASDLILISIGVKPLVKLAVEAGLVIGPTGGIAVNALLQTSDPDILAIGDAAESQHGVTGKAVRIPLAGPANRNGRLAGERAAVGIAPAAAPVLGTSIVGFFGRAAAITGLSAKEAAFQKIPYAVAYATRAHHAGYYPGAETMILKIVYDPINGKLLGGQAVGGAGVDKRIDVLATAIAFGGTIDQLANLDLAYAPQFGSAKDPLHIAAFIAQNQRAGILHGVSLGESIPSGQLVDVRSEKEVALGTLVGARNIPLPTLRSRIGELDPKQPTTVFCQGGQRGYYAARILMQSGFDKVYNLSGGYTLWKDFS